MPLIACQGKKIEKKRKEKQRNNIRLQGVASLLTQKEKNMKN
jgi:hypothetical protein